MPGPEKHEQNTVKAPGNEAEQGARHDLQQEALRLFQCKDGSLVSRPIECTKTIGESGFLAITPIIKQG